MEKIKALFWKDIYRTIEEVIKVDQADQETVKSEIEEYIATDSIKEHYREVLDAYHSAKNAPTEGIGVWISGFFGSGKSSFAKNLGYALANRDILGEKASEKFSAQVGDAKITNLLTLINTQIKTHAVIFDVSMDRGTRSANERITAVMYKALLRELDYAEDFDLAELERSLEADDILPEFEDTFERKFKKPWRVRRKIGRALNEASATLHEIDPGTYPQADSWVRSLGVKDANGNIKGRADISANKLAELSFELMARRKPGSALIFIIDEVGQYVSRSVDRMLDLQAIVQAFGKVGKNMVKAKQALAPSWIVVTSQEKLNEIVDALDSKKIELARLQDRFPVRIDLEPADIAEVTGKRVLQKRPDAEKILNELFDHNESRLAAHTKLERTNRKMTIDKKEFIDLYPYLPYHIDLCIDIMSGIRLQPGAQRHTGGSNRTIIKQAQQMLISDRVGLASEDIGALVTLDKVYELVDGNLSTEKRKDIADISKQFASQPLYAKIAKALCLLEFVRDLPRTPQNIAAVLYENIEGVSRVAEIEQALKDLEDAQFVRLSEDGFKLQTAQEKNWDTARRGIDPKPTHRNQIKKDIFTEIFSDHRIRTYRYKNLRSFRLGVTVDGEKNGDDGDILIHLIVSEDDEDFKIQSKDAREESRNEKGRNQLFWVIIFLSDIHREIEELHRSREMIATYERIAAQGKLTVEESTCLNEEKNRKERIHRSLKVKISNALKNGLAYFRGVEKDTSSLGDDLVEIRKELLDFAMPDLFPKLEMGAKKLSGKEVEQILKADNLSGLSNVFYDGPDGLKLVIKEGAKFVPNPSAEIAREIFDYLKNMNSYGEKVTGKDLEEHFGGIGYGWEREVMRLVLATLFRAGMIEVTSQGQKYSDYTNTSSRHPFVNNNAFKSASFAPYISGVTLKLLTDAAKNYEALTGEEINVEKGPISSAFKQMVIKEREDLLPVKAEAHTLLSTCEEFLNEHLEWLEAVQKSSPDDSIKTLASEGKTYSANRSKLKKITDVFAEPNLPYIRKAKNTIDTKLPIIKNLTDKPDEITKAAERLKDALLSETFYERLPDIRECEKKICDFYKEKYYSLHEQRFAILNEKIESIKSHPVWGSLPDDNRKSILMPLASCVCEECSLESEEVLCEHCQASFLKIESDIAKAEGLREAAMQKIEKMINPEVIIENIKISDYIRVSVETEEELNEGLEKVRDLALKYISEGKKVIFL
ncbi:MAG: BREX system P-loop protein BrxC [bacterium]